VIAAQQRREAAFPLTTGSTLTRSQVWSQPQPVPRGTLDSARCSGKRSHVAASKFTGRSGPDPQRLRERQEAFCLAFATTGNRRLALEKGGYSTAPGWRQNVQKMLVQPKIMARIKELRKEISAKETTLCAVSREMVLTELWDNVKRAKSAVPVLDAHGQETGEWKCDLASANRALELVGKSMALFTDKVLTEDLDRSLTGMTDEQVNDLIDALIIESGPTRVRKVLERHEGLNGQSREGEGAAGAETPEAPAVRAVPETAGVPPGRLN